MLPVGPTGAAPVQSALVVAFAQALTELVTVEKKNIVALTEVARDALRTEPQVAPMLATLIANRVLQAPPAQKLPVLYLLDSVSKMVGEPYKGLFGPSLPEVFMATWQAGGPGLHRPLDKLLATWAGIFPQHLLADIHSRLGALRAAAAPAQVQPPAGYAYGVPQQPGFTPQPPAQFQPAPGFYQQQAPAPQPLQQLGPPAGFAPAQPAPQPAMQPQQQQPAPQVNVTDLLSSLVSAGLLAPPGAQRAAAPAAAGGAQQQYAAPPAAPRAGATPPPEREQPATTSFIPERLKEPNPSAVARLLRVTELTKSRFLDRKFLRRQQKAGGAAARGSRLWYLPVETWMESTVAQAGSAAAAAAGGGAAGGARDGQAAVALDPSKFSVPVDDVQTCCALSGEAFEQFWDEGHQEWRYRGAKALDAEEAASYGLEEGALVLVSALGAPAGAPGGVLAELAAQQEVAADLAAAVEAGSAGAAGGDAKDAKPELKLADDAAAAAAAAAAAEGGSEPPEKRQRVG